LKKLKVNKNTKRTEKLLTIRVTNAELFLIKQRAKEKGKDVSKFVRHKAIGKRLPMRFTEKNIGKLARLVRSSLIN